jgi:NOL1/NOP2/fmu family ribosome biogenesis protein
VARRLLDELVKRFGFPPGLFRTWALVAHEEDVFITTPEAEEFDRIKPVRKGLRLARIFPHGFKPTTNAMQVFGARATRNTVELTRDQAQSFVSGTAIALAAQAEDGFVIVRHDGFTLGVGLYRHGQLKSQVPLSRRTHG